MSVLVYLAPNDALFNQHVFDSNQLSAIRGGSAALLFAPRWFGAQLADAFPDKSHLLFRGASTGAWRIAAGANDEATVKAVQTTCEGIWTNLRNATDFQPSTNDAAALALDAKGLAALACIPMTAAAVAMSADASEQDEELSALLKRAEDAWQALAEARLDAVNYVQVSGKYKGAMCALTGRVADEQVDFPADDTVGWTGSKPRLLSRTVARRVDYGRDVRSDYFERLAHDGQARTSDGKSSAASKSTKFAASFQDQLAAMPKITPSSAQQRVCSKIAVFYADINKLGSLMRGQKKPRDAKTLSALGSTMKPVKAESVDGWSADWDSYGTKAERIRTEFQVEGLLKPWHKRLAQIVARSGDGDVYPFETLMFGGDEMLFVMPASLSLPFLEHYFNAVAGWRLPLGRRDGEDDLPLSVSAGMVICDRKTPIRRATSLAAQLANDIKALCHYNNAPGGSGEQLALSDLRSMLQIEVAHSVDLPDGYLHQQRARVFGKPKGGGPGDLVGQEAELRRHIIDCHPLSDKPDKRDPASNGFSRFLSAARRLYGGEGEHEGTGGGGELAALPRSQIYRALQRARVAQDGLNGPSAYSALQEYLERVRGLADEAANYEQLHLFGPRDDQRPPDVTNLVMLARLWDYLAAYECLAPQLTGAEA